MKMQRGVAARAHVRKRDGGSQALGHERPGTQEGWRHQVAAQERESGCRQVREAQIARPAKLRSRLLHLGPRSIPAPLWLALQTLLFFSLNVRTLYLWGLGMGGKGLLRGFRKT